MIEIKWNPSRRELKWFAALLPLFFALFGSVRVHFYSGSVTVWQNIFVGALVVAIVGWFSPKFMRYVYVGWMLAIYPLAFVVSHLILAAVYYLVLSPVGLMMRLCGYDPMQRRFDKSAKTYWIRREQQTETKRYFRQY